MTQDFLDGMLVVLLPSMLAVAWLLWGATHADSDFQRGRPGCPTCGAIMRLLWIEPDWLRRDRYTYECRSCKEQIEVTVERELEAVQTRW